MRIVQHPNPDRLLSLFSGRNKTGSGAIAVGYDKAKGMSFFTIVLPAGAEAGQTVSLVTN